MQNKIKRSDNEWLEALSGLLGPEEQDSALIDLANYLYVVARNNLVKRGTTVLGLENSSYQDLGMLAEEFVQQYMEKMIREDFKLLDKYSGHGSFLGWAAQVTVNLCNSELRRKSWHVCEQLEQRHNLVHDNVVRPEAAAIQGHLREVIADCLNELPERYRIALTRCIMEGESAAVVGEAMNVSANAVHVLVCRARKMMRKLLEEAGIGPDSLSAFAPA